MSRFIPGPGPWVFVAAALVLAVVILWTARCMGDAAPAPPLGRMDTASSAEVLDARPAPGTPTIVQRVVRVPVPVEVIVSRETPDTARVRAFARKVFEAESLRAVIRQLQGTGGDTSAVAHPAPILPPSAGAYDGGRLTLWLSRSDGSVMRATARVAPRFSWRTGQGDRSDTVPLLTGDRWWVRATREAAGCSWKAGAPGAAVGALVADDAVQGAVLGALLGLGACLAD